MNVVKLNEPYCLNLEDNKLEYIGTYIKGKKGQGVEDYRVLFKGLITEKDYLFMLEKRDFSMCSWYMIVLLDFKYISKTHLKNKVWNYYYFNNDINTVHEFFDAWKKSDPIIPTGDYYHQFISDIDEYTWAYKVNNNKY